MSVAEFDMIPTDKIYEPMHESLEAANPEPDLLQAKMEPLGFETVWMLSNLGSILIFVGLWLLLVMTYYLMGALLLMCPCCPCTKFCRRKRKGFGNWVMWNWPISFVRDSYSVIAICSLYNVAYASHDTWESSLNSSLAIIFLILMLVYPAALLLYLYNSRRTLADRRVHIPPQFAAAHEGLNI